MNSVQSTPGLPLIATVGVVTCGRRRGRTDTVRHSAVQRNIEEGQQSKFAKSRSIANKYRFAVGVQTHLLEWEMGDSLIAVAAGHRSYSVGFVLCLCRHGHLLRR